MGGIAKPVGSRPQPAVRISDPVDKSRPTGRPRKIPRSGLPKGLTPSQVAKYKQSQQAAARYQKMKAEKEIGKRISRGEDPLIVRQTVYAEMCARYVEAGEEVPPILQSMVDQEMIPKTPAPEPNSSVPVDPREIPVELQEVPVEVQKVPVELQSSEIFNKEFLSYLPSVAAHTQQVVGLANVLSTGPINQAKEPCSPEKPAPEACFLSIPSVAAHSRPFLASWYMSEEIPVLGTQRVQGRQSKLKNQAMVKSSTLQKIHTHLDQVSPVLRSDTLRLKRKRSSSNGPEVGELSSSQYLPSIAAHTQLPVNGLELPLAEPDFNSEHIFVPSYKRQRVDGSARKNLIAPRSRALKEKTYEELSRSISRSGKGVFVGEHALRARAKGQRGRTKYTRLAIFQSARLNQFTWFLEKTDNPESSNITTLSDNQEVLTISAASSSNSASRTEPRPYLPSVLLSSQSPPNLGHWINHTSSSNVSTHLDRDAFDRKHHMIPEIADNDLTSHEAIYNNPRDLLSPRTSTPAAGEGIEELQTRHQAIPSEVPSISGFTPINKADIGRATKTIVPRKSANPKAIHHGVTASRRLSQASLKMSPIAAPHHVEEIQGDGGSSGIDRSSSSQEPEVIGSFLGTRESGEGLIDPRNSQEPVSSSLNVSRSNPCRPKPLDLSTNSPKFSQAVKSLPNGPEISEDAPMVVDEQPRKPSPSPNNAIVNSLEENRTPIQGLTFRSIGSDSSTPSKVVSNTRTRKVYQSTSFRQVAAGGGSVGVLRRKIIMDIIESCGGVYPGVRELLSPFVTAWMKLDRSGRPDARTVQTAFNYLVCQACKIRTVTFTFRTAKGLLVTKTMATLNNISPTDQKVKDMQQNIISTYPGYYFPPEAEFSEETRNSGSYLSRYGRHTSVKDLEFEKEDQVQLQHKPAFDVRLEQKQARAEMRSELSKLKNMEARAVRLAETGLLVRMQSVP